MFTEVMTPLASCMSHRTWRLGGLTSGDTAVDARTGSPHYVVMIISPRDGRILRLVGRFGQASTNQIRVLEFSENKARSRPNYVLARLVENGLLRKVEPRRTVGGWAGGSGQYVYQLGSKGWLYLRREGKYSPFRSIDMHRLGIVDAYVATVELGRTGAIRINEVVEEPECHQTVAGVLVTPDLYINAAVPLREPTEKATHGLRRIWIEVDMGTERRAKITDKLARYRHAYRAWEDERPGQRFPRIVFVAIDEERERELLAIISEMPESGRKLFGVCLPETFAQVWG